MKKNLNMFDKKANQIFPGSVETFKNTVIFHTSIFEEIKPITILCRILGIFPFSIESGKASFKMISLPVFYSALCYISIGSYNAYLAIQSVPAVYSGNQEFDYVVLMSSYFIFLIPHFLIYPSYWIYGQSVVKYFCELQQFEACFYQVMGQPLLLNINRVCWIISLSFPILIIVWTITIWIVGEMEPVASIFYSYVNIFLGFHGAVWCINCYCLLVAGQQLLSRLQEALGDSPRPETVEKYRSLWLNLCDLVHTLCRGMGHSMCQILLLSFISNVLSTYGLLSATIRSKLDLRHLMIFIHDGYWLMILFALCNTSYLLSQMVGTNFSNQISQYYMKSSTIIKQELDRFLQVIASNPPTVSFCGYVVVDRDLFVSMSATMVTYLVVLLQFSHED